jgi:PAS domain S-box-containing protein
LAKWQTNLLRNFVSSPVTKSAYARYGIAILATALALELRSLLSPLFGERNPYHSLWAAVMFCAWYCGLGPSIVATFLGAIGVWYYFLHPTHSFAVPDGQQLWGLVAFLVLAGMIIWMGEVARRKSMELAERNNALTQSEARYRELNEQLEQRVRQRAKDLELRAEKVREQAEWLDAAHDAIFVRTVDGEISYWNAGAERLYGWSKAEALGRSPFDLLKTTLPVSLEELARHDRWEGELEQSKRDGSRIIVAARLTTLRNTNQQPAGWLEICTDITLRKRAEQAMRLLSGRILHAQDEERRRIARELHDSLGQYLTSLKINIDVLKNSDRSISPEERISMLSASSEMLQQCLLEVRTISHLLHPPLLDEAGLVSAVNCFIDGFSKRSGIKTTVNLPADYERLPRDVETTLFRVLQEALTNVVRHSESENVDVTLLTTPNSVTLEVTDFGKGIPLAQLTQLREGRGPVGVGLGGMRERVNQLGGSFDINSGETGTSVSVTIPLSNNQPEKSGLDPNNGRRSSAA